MAAQNIFFGVFHHNPTLDKTMLYHFEMVTMLFLSKRQSEVIYTRKVALTYVGKRKELFVYHALTTNVAIKSDQIVQNEKFFKEGVFAFGIIVLGANDKGEIVKIYNLKEMENRWSKRVQDLKKDYTGYEFELFVDDIFEVLRDEEKALKFLNSKRKLGLYFHGLFEKNNTNEILKEQKITVPEFDHVDIIEKISIDNKESKIIITAQKSNDNMQRIISSTNEITKYESEIFYDKNSQLVNGFQEIEDKNKKIKYSISWVG